VVDREVAEFFKELSPSKNSYRLEELIAPMVYKNLSTLGDRMSIVRQVIEKACHIF